MFNTQVDLMADGVLFGFTYFGVNDRAEAFAGEDWFELNIYLFILRISIRWF